MPVAIMPDSFMGVLLKNLRRCGGIIGNFSAVLSRK
jgi:hypothetical protein